MKLPNTGITSTIVANAIGAGSRKWSVLCTHPNINKWSKWKPVRHPTKTPLTDSQLASTDSGLIPFGSTNYNDSVTSKWIYQRPTGSDSSPYRLGDFRNYNHDALPPVTLPNNVHISNQTSHTFALGINNETGDIELVDFSGDLEGYYYGIVFKRGTSEYIQTAKFPFGVGQGAISVDTTHTIFTLGGNVEANHILVNRKIEAFTLLSNITESLMYKSIPTADDVVNKTNVSTTRKVLEVDITMIASDLVGRMSPVTGHTSPTGNKFVTNGALYLQLSIVNNSNQAETLQNMRLSADPTYYGPSGFYFVANMYDSAKAPISSLYVPSGQSRTLIIGTDNLLNTDEGTIKPKPTTLMEIFSNIKVINNASTVVSSKSIRFASILSWDL